MVDLTRGFWRSVKNLVSWDTVNLREEKPTFSQSQAIPCSCLKGSYGNFRVKGSFIGSNSKVPPLNLWENRTSEANSSNQYFRLFSYSLNHIKIEFSHCITMTLLLLMLHKLKFLMCLAA